MGLEASLRRERGSHVALGSILSSAGIAGTAILAALGAIWAVTPLPLIAGLALGYGSFRSYRPIAERTKLGLERVLDHLERGEVKPAHRLPPHVGGTGSRSTQGTQTLIVYEKISCLISPKSACWAAG